MDRPAIHVLMLGWEFPPHISGGLGTACEGLTKGLVHHGVGVTFVLPRAVGDEAAGAVRVLGANTIPLPAGASSSFRPPTPPRFLAIGSALSPYLSAAAYGARTAAPAARAPWEKGVDDHPHRVQVSDRPLEFSGFYGPDLFSEVERYAAVAETLASSERFDVVHAHDWMTWPAGEALARASGKPFVAHVHATEHDRAGERADPAIVDVERRGLEAADRVICVSRYTADLVERLYGVDPEKVRVVHNAVTPREPFVGVRPRRAIDEPIVLFLGRVTFQKGPEAFLEAAARVVAVEPRVKFVMGGSGDMLPAMVERAAALGLARHVHFTGFVRGADVERTYALADVYVMPSVSEPFGIAPLEAMASDVPVIVSRKSGVSEVLRDALLFDPWDVVDLADKILAVLKRPGLAKHLAVEGRAEVRRMRWEVRAGLVLDVYRELVTA